MIKRIFYFNINYTCNNNCIFCYSHNTIHNSKVHNEISLKCFIKYLENNNISSDDRVILNGGEPLMHSNINEILEILKTIRCETVIFTNGRLLDRINLSILNEKFRFVVPIHGYENLHDEVTRVKGSYMETVKAMKLFDNELNKCLIDLKIILNDGMIKNKEEFKKTLNALDTIYFNNAVHITKMADTIVSKKNKCVSMNDNNIVAHYTQLLFNHFSKYNHNIKIFDTCIKDIKEVEYYSFDKLEYCIQIKGKDYAHEEEIEICENLSDCMNECKKKKYCLSSVFDYKVLEFSENRFYENME